MACFEERKVRQSLWGPALQIRSKSQAVLLLLPCVYYVQICSADHFPSQFRSSRLFWQSDALERLPFLSCWATHPNPESVTRNCSTPCTAACYTTTPATSLSDIFFRDFWVKPTPSIHPTGWSIYHITSAKSYSAQLRLSPVQGESSLLRFATSS